MKTCRDEVPLRPVRALARDLVSTWNGELLRDSDAPANDDAHVAVGQGIRYYQEGSGPCRAEVVNGTSNFLHLEPELLR